MNEELQIHRDSIESLKDLLKIQCSDGNWNYDPYMHGMANGMILALSLFGDNRPNYLEAPDQWLKDVDAPEKPELAINTQVNK